MSSETKAPELSPAERVRVEAFGFDKPEVGVMSSEELIAEARKRYPNWIHNDLHHGGYWGFQAGAKWALECLSVPAEVPPVTRETAAESLTELIWANIPAWEDSTVPRWLAEAIVEHWPYVSVSPPAEVETFTQWAVRMVNSHNDIVTVNDADEALETAASDKAWTSNWPREIVSRTVTVTQWVPVVAGDQK